MGISELQDLAKPKGHLFCVGDRVHLNHKGHWLYATVADCLPDSSVIVAGYMANWAARVWPENLRMVCKTCQECKSLIEKPNCAYPR
jgi:hypothetical protein